MKILYATDGSGAAAVALQVLEQFSLTEADSVHVVSVLSFPPAASVTGLDLVSSAWEAMTEIYVEERNLAERAVAEAAAALQSGPASATTEVREGEPAREILAAAEDCGAELIVVGSRGLTGLERFFLGSVARNVAKHSRVPVLVAREPKAGLAHAILATDGSDHSRHAAEFAGRLPLPSGADITVVNVVRPYAPFPGILPTDRAEFNAAVLEVNRRNRAAGEALATETQKLLGDRRESRAIVRVGDPAAEILSLAEETNADLIIAGARGVSLLEGLLVGSVADRLLKEAPCSVLLVR